MQIEENDALMAKFFYSNDQSRPCSARTNAYGVHKRDSAAIKSVNNGRKTVTSNSVRGDAIKFYQNTRPYQSRHDRSKGDVNASVLGGVSEFDGNNSSLHNHKTGQQ